MGGITESIFGSDDAEDAARDASRAQTEWQKDALDYLKQSERLPQAARDAAIKRLGGYFGVPMFDEEGQEIQTGAALPDQAERIKLAQESPLYNALMAGRKAGEESIMRNAAMTGGLRSGNVQQAMYDYNTQLQAKALADSYNQQIAEENRYLEGLGGLAGLRTLAPQIAGQMSSIGQTIGQGITAENLAGRQKNQQIVGDVASLAGMFAMSDQRLKENIKLIGKRNGFNWYRWGWNNAARSLGLSGTDEGVIAQEVQQIKPEAVAVINGYLAVNYAALEA